MTNPIENIKIDDIDNDYIETLKNNLTTLKGDLESIKLNNDLKMDEKKKKTEELNKKIGDLSKKIDNSIKILENYIKDFDVNNANQSEQNIYDERVKLKKSLQELQAEAIEPIKKEISDLHDSIVKSEEKGFFGKAGEWIGEQRDAVRDKDKWGRSSEGGKNLLRTAGFVATGIGAAALMYKGVKSLWNRAFGDNEEDEETSEEQENNKEKKDKDSRRKRVILFLIDHPEKKTK